MIAIIDNYNFFPHLIFEVFKWYIFRLCLSHFNVLYRFNLSTGLLIFIYFLVTKPKKLKFFSYSLTLSKIGVFCLLEEIIGMHTG